MCRDLSSPWFKSSCTRSGSSGRWRYPSPDLKWQNYKKLNLWNLQNIFLHAVISFLFTYLAQMICQNPKRTLQQWLAVSSKGTPEQKLIFNVFINRMSWPYHDRGASWRCRALKFSRSFQQILLLHSCHIAIASRKTKRGSQILLLLSLAMFAAPTVCSW